MTNPKMIRGLLILLFALAVGSTVCFVFLPRQRAIADLRRQVEARMKYIQESQHLDALIVKMENDLAAVSSYVDNRASQAPADGDLDAVFGSIANEAESSGVETKRFQPHPEYEKGKDEDAIKRMAATLVTEGDFQQLFDFLGRLERLPLTFWIDGLQLQHVEDGSDRLTCELNLVIFADNRGNSD
jgi:Tfp pilus assembly protein PilO